MDSTREIAMTEGKTAVVPVAHRAEDGPGMPHVLTFPCSLVFSPDSARSGNVGAVPVIHWRRGEAARPRPPTTPSSETFFELVA